MATLVRLPKVADNIEEGMVRAWRKRVGDAVAKDEALVEIVTDKAAFEIPAEVAGVLLRVCAAEKSSVPTNYILAVIGSPGEEAPEVDAENRKLLAACRQRAAVDWDKAKETAPAARRVNVKATPAARRLARELGVELGGVRPADGDMIREDDVRRAYN